MLITELPDVFSADDSDVGSASNRLIMISLKDDISLQATYKPIRRNLYKELKNYVEDFLYKNWTTNSEFPYSSPVFVVREKNGNLRRCCD